MANLNESYRIVIGIIVVLALAFGIYYYMNMGKKVEAPRMMEEAPSQEMKVSSDVQGTGNPRSQMSGDQQQQMMEHFEQDPGVMATQETQNEYPKQQLSAQELLPQDNSSQWAQVYPTGEGSLKDRNFLQAGYHIGINTVGQTLRNANLQLRSEPPCPQVKVSPWIQSTIEPDLGRKPFEIGGCA
jgi:hypothetical protein